MMNNSCFTNLMLSGATSIICINIRIDLNCDLGTCVTGDFNVIHFNISLNGNNQCSSKSKYCSQFLFCHLCERDTEMNIPPGIWCRKLLSRNDIKIQAHFNTQKMKENKSFSHKSQQYRTIRKSFCLTHVESISSQ